MHLACGATDVQEPVPIGAREPIEDSVAGEDRARAGAAGSDLSGAAINPSSTSNADPIAARRGFAHVDTWVFDLDNTLYPHHLNLWQQVDDRIRVYIADFLGLDHDDAFRKQKDFYRRYGTTLRGLMIEHGMKPDDFLDYVHRIDHSPIEPIRRSARRWSDCRAASSSSPTARARMPTR